MMWSNSHDYIIIRGAFKHIRLISRSRIIVEIKPFKLDEQERKIRT